ncbi:MAG TPA: hypothetical protein DDY22_00920 [Geobacter sp.]|nr:hypothetical protein [Geobacter sp.]
MPITRDDIGSRGNQSRNHTSFGHYPPVSPVGYSFDCLTQSEARYLTDAPDADTIRDRIAEAE